ncbi:hypothetical protein [Salinisphaera sp. Q1T1-3]|uniref:hypothetical protein n=1 Tax=Salinisphaera sp. Q1T1-3 TaxID=2321229 RepID=UPI000E72B583|nr:hypothetical protein [Salinisphaera sp. Q1T1-3]RJS94119.1 hypothetical protein D3260_06045 [Salinisphaera sp. Q1T1-3]
MPETDDRLAVITGDIVKSSALSETEFEAVMQALETAGRAIAAWPGVQKLDYERFRGDGWQLVLAPAVFGLRAALIMRAAVRSAVAASETRLALGIGPGTRGSSPGTSAGPAFERSGQALDALARHRLWAFGGTLGDSCVDQLTDGLLGLADERSQAWTARQADIAARLLAPAAPSMAALADACGLRPQTVSSHFARAGGHALQDAVERFETVTGHIGRAAAKD